jgi:hypothetical protein
MPSKPMVDKPVVIKDTTSKVKSQRNNSLSFSSSRTGVKPSARKRKAVGDLSADVQDDGQSKPSTKKRAKKPAPKTLLSFSDDA